MTTIERYRMHLEGIRFRARHGVSKAEREIPQDFTVDLTVELPISLLPKSDSRSRVFDYDRLAGLVVDEGTRTSYRLLEVLAERVIDRVLKDTPALTVLVRVKKMRPPTGASVEAAAVELMATANR